MNLRPDEIAAYSEVLRNQEISNKAKSGLKTAANIGLTAAGLGLSTKILPFLNELIPMDLAIKGISKVAPQIGNFLKKGQAMGLDLKQGMQFIKDNIQNQQQNPLQEFETNYPDLASAMQNQINKGQTPQAAAAILKTSSQFGGKVRKLEKDFGKNFNDYVLELFGQPQEQQASQQMNQPQNIQQAQQNTGKDPQLMNLINNIRGAMQKLVGEQ